MSDETSEVRSLDAAAVRAALGPGGAVAAIEAAVRSGFDPTTDPSRTVVGTSHGQLLLMPSEALGYAGVKVATVAPDNPAAGLPRIQASYLLFDAATLSLRAVLDGTALTTLRTPAVSLAAVRPALARTGSGPVRVVVFGAGPQAVGHVDTLAAVLGRSPESVTFVVRRPEAAGPDATARGTVLGTDDDAVAPALAAAHVVVCATSARTPLFEARQVRPDAVVIAVGSHEPDARELDAALLAAAQVVVEDRETALREAGDVILAIDEGALTPEDLVPMADVVVGRVALSSDRAVVFKSTGMSWEDLVVAAGVVAAA